MNQFKFFSQEEQGRFIDALDKCSFDSTGKEWEKIAQQVGGGRSVAEVKYHASLYFNFIYKTNKGSEAIETGPPEFLAVPDEEQWSLEEDVIFEQALTTYEEGDIARWQKIAELLPSRTPEDVQKHYELLMYDIVQIIHGGKVSVTFALQAPPPKPKEVTTSDSAQQMDEALENEDEEKNDGQSNDSAHDSDMDEEVSSDEGDDMDGTEEDLETQVATEI